MDGENPTAGDSGASITDRLANYLSAGEKPETTPEAKPETEQPQASAEVSENAEGDAPQQATEPQYTTSDLAKVLGLEESALDVDDEGNPVFKAKIDGKEVPAKLADLLKSYQLSGHAENKVREAAELKKAAEQRAQEVEQQFAQRLQGAERLATYAAQELMREFQSVNWPALEQADPGQAALLRQKYAERNAQLQNVLQGVQQGNQQIDMQREARRQAFLAEEQEKLPTFIPEWKDAEVANKEKTELVKWCLDKGYTTRFVESLSNSSALEVATVVKAMRFDKLQQAKPAIENRVRTAPKLVKPGNAQPQGKEAKLNDLKTQIRKTGGKQGVADYLKAKGIV